MIDGQKETKRDNMIESAEKMPFLSRFRKPAIIGGGITLMMVIGLTALGGRTALWRGQAIPSHVQWYKGGRHQQYSIKETELIVTNEGIFTVWRSRGFCNQ